MSYVRNIKTTFWDDSKVCDFSADAKYLFMYLITSPQSNITGCYELSTTTIQNTTGLSKSRIEAAFHELDKNDVVRYDSNTHEVLIINYYKHNWGNSPKVIQSVEKCARYIKSPTYMQYILSLVQKQNESTSFENTSSPHSTNTVSIPYPYSIDTVSIPNSYSSNSNSDSVSNTDTNTINKESDDTSSNFNLFWSAYPKKKCKADAFKAWMKRKPPVNDVLNAIAKQKKSSDWIKDNGQYIPYPAKWINGMCWEDEVTQGSLYGHVHIDASDSQSYETYANQIDELNTYDE